jgi:F-type H+-transporting ATPase subunit delta
MSEQRAASRYAKSLLDLAQERGTLAEAKQDMDLFAKTLNENRDLRLLLRNPIVKQDKKLAILKAIFGGKVSELTERFLAVVSQHNRESALEWVATEFQSQYNMLQGMQEASVTSASPLTPELRAEMVALVKRQTGLASVELTEKVDPNLIGGFVLRIGDTQIDDSVRTSLRKMRISLQENSYQNKL